MPKGVKASLTKAVVNQIKNLYKQLFLPEEVTAQTAFKSDSNCSLIQLSDT